MSQAKQPTFLKKVYSLTLNKLREIALGENLDNLIQDRRKRNYKNQSDGYFFGHLVSVIFASGFNSSILEKKWDATVRAFSNFDIDKVANYSGGDIQKLIKDKKIIKNERKIRACVKNAKEMQQVIKSFGSFQKYIESFDDLEILKEDLIKRFSFLGPTTVYDFMKEIGFNFIKPDVHVRRIFYRLGLIETDKDIQEIRGKIQEIGKMMAEAVHEKLSVVDAIFWLYGSGNTKYVEKAICKRKPLCEECPLAELCQYFKTCEHSATIPELPKEERPRERLAKGESLATQELLAIILRTGYERKNVLEVANNLLAKYSGDIEALFSADINELKEIKGVGFTKAVQLKAVFELYKKLIKSTGKEKPIVKSPQDIVNLVPEMRYLKEEHFKVICLDSRNRASSPKTISIGSLNTNLTEAREIFKPAISESSKKIILVHNHSEDNPNPSEDDIGATKKLIKLGKSLGIKVLDHIIIGDKGFISLKGQGLI